MMMMIGVETTRRCVTYVNKLRFGDQNSSYCSIIVYIMCIYCMCRIGICCAFSHTPLMYCQFAGVIMRVYKRPSYVCKNRFLIYTFGIFMLT